MPSPSSLLRGTLRFGPFELEPASGELRRDGAPLILPEQSRRLLAALVAAPGQLVARDRLCDELWPDGTWVDFEHGLNAAMRRLREALGDRAGTPGFIETLPRRGYRFVAPVSSVPAPAACRTSVAVLPFLSPAPDVDHGFTGGIEEDLLTELARVGGLRVVSGTSSMRFRYGDRSVREIAKALRVDVVVEGSVRLAGGRVRIAARVIDGRSDEPLWAEAFDGDLADIFSIQKDAARRVATALTPGLPGACVPFVRPTRGKPRRTSIARALPAASPGPPAPGKGA